MARPKRFYIDGAWHCRSSIPGTMCCTPDCEQAIAALDALQVTLSSRKRVLTRAKGVSTPLFRPTKQKLHFPPPAASEPVPSVVTRTMNMDSETPTTHSITSWIVLYKQLKHRARQGR
jgi:hypothetical protein